MYAVAPQLQIITQVNIRISEIGGQQRIIIFYRAGKQQRSASFDFESKHRKVACILVIKAFGIGDSAGKIAVVIEHGKCVAMLQRAGTAFKQRCSSRYIKLRDASLGVAHFHANCLKDLMASLDEVAGSVWYKRT